MARLALDQGLTEPRSAALIRSLNRIVDGLSWVQGYARVPPALARKYGYAELMGPRGPVVSERLILGLVLLAPRCTYPAHSHDGISESYICLSGTVSENDTGAYAPGSLIFNPPEHRHRLTTGDNEPALLAYAWSGPSDKLAAQTLKFSRR